MEIHFVLNYPISERRLGMLLKIRFLVLCHQDLFFGVFKFQFLIIGRGQDPLELNLG